MLQKGVAVLIVFVLFACTSLQGQYNIKENSVWAFGFNAGLDFNGGTPMGIKTAINSQFPLNSCALVSDSNGNLLFYCSPDSIWSRNGFVMPNGYNLMPFIWQGQDTSYQGALASQGALILPVLNKPSQYYVFSIQRGDVISLGSHVCRLFYSVVDMSLNGGWGDVLAVKKGIELDSGLSEKMIAIPDDNCGIWLLLHGMENDTFKAYNISGSGISSTPVISQAGNLHGLYAYGGGVMKISNDRKKLAVCSGSVSTVVSSLGIELCDFNPTTGVVSNAVTLDSGKIYLGACFSANNNLLYTFYDSLVSFNGVVTQYDISLSSTAAIINSRKNIYDNLYFSYEWETDLKLGPDNKIYLNSPSNHNSLDRIDSPDIVGYGCHYTAGAVALYPGTAVALGLPNVYVKPMCAAAVAPGPLKETLKIYPNPVVDEMTIECGQSAATISIYNVLGQVVYSTTLYKNKTTISAKGFPKGVYVVELAYGDGMREVRRVLKD